MTSCVSRSLFVRGLVDAEVEPSGLWRPAANGPMIGASESKSPRAADTAGGATRKGVPSVHDASYDPSAHLEALAAERETATGSLLVQAADEFKSALCAFLSEWQGEYDDGRSMQLPDRFPGIVEFWLGAHETAERARDLDERRNLCYVLATAEAA